MLTNLSPLTQTELNSAIIRSPLIVSPQATVIEAIALMSGICSNCETTVNEDSHEQKLHLEAKSSCVLVTENGRLRGILTEKDVVRLSAEGRSLDTLSVEEVMVSSVITLAESQFTDLFFALNLLQQYQIHHLPIVDEDHRLVGLVTNETIRQLSRPIDLLRLRQVEEVVTREVITANPQTSILAIAKQMAESQVSSIVITENHRAIGIITERDLVQCQALRISLENSFVEQVMSTPVFTIEAQESLLKVQNLMKRHLIRRLIVTGENEEIVGVVTQSDVLKALNSSEMFNLVAYLEQKVSQLESEKIALLENRAIELEEQIKERTTELEKQRQREKLIAEITQKIRNSLNLTEILNTCVNELRTFSHCDRVLVFQFEPDWSGIITAESVAENLPVSLGNVIRDSCYQSQAETLYQITYPIIVDNIYSANYQDCHIELLEQYQVKANLILPIYVQEKLWGLLVGHQCQDYRNWQPEDVNLFTEISTKLAIAVQQSLHHQQLHTELIKRQESENRFRQLAENIDQVFYLTDFEQNRVLYVSPSYETIWQRTCQSVYDDPQSFMDAVIAEDKPRVIQSYQLQQIGQSTETEYRIVRPNGEIRWIFDRSFPVKGVSTQRICGIATDITDRKLAEIELEESRNFSQLIAEINSRFVSVDSNDFETEVSQTLKLISEKTNADRLCIFTLDDTTETMIHEYGWCSDQLRDCPAMPKKIPYSMFPWLNSVLKQGQNCVIGDIDQLPPSARMEGENWLKLGIRSIFLCPLFRQNCVVGFIGICSIKADRHWKENQIKLLNIISQTILNTHLRIEQEKQLKITSDRLQEAHRISKLGHWEYDIQENKITYWSEEIYKIYEVDPQEFIPTYQGFFNFVHPDDRQLVDNSYWQHVNQKIPYYIVHRLQMPDGRIKYLHEQCETKYAEDGTPLCSGGVTYDITLLKEAELRLQQLNQELETKVAERTKELCQINNLQQGILNSANYSIISINNKGIIQSFNKGAEEMLGYRAEEVIGRVTPELFTDTQTIQDLANSLSQELAREILPNLEVFTIKSRLGMVNDFKLTTIRKDGSRFRMFFSVNALKNEVQEIIGYVGIGKDITEEERAEQQRKRAESELKASETRFRRVFDSNMVGFMFTNFAGDIVDANDRFLEIIGYTRAELEAGLINWANLTPPEYRQQDLDTIYHLQHHPVIDPWEKAYYHKDGHLVYILVGIALLDDQGNCVCLIIDISDRKQTEQENQRLKERLEFLLSASPAAIFTCNPDGNYTATFVSENIQQITGYNPEQFLTQSDFWATHIHPEDKEMVFSGLTQLSFKETHFHEYRFQHQNGSYIWIFTQLQLIKDDFGNPYELVGYFADITTHKQMELERQKLLQELSTFKNGLDKAAIVATTDSRGVITYVNDRFCDISGYSREELMGQTHRLLKSNTHPPKFFQDLWETISHGKIWQGEICNQAKNGSLYWLESSIIPFIGESGEIEQYLEISFDITERKFIEKQIIKENYFRQQILDTMTDGLCVCHGIEEYPFMNFTIWNPKMEEITGYTKAEINELGWYQSLYPDPEIQYQAIKRMERMRQGENLHNEEWQIQPQYGEPKIISISTSIIVDDNSQSFILAIIQDITQQKRQEKENNALKQQLEFVLASSPAVIFALDTKDSTPTFISGNIQKILGYSAETFIRQPFHQFLDLIHPEDTYHVLPEVGQLSPLEIYQSEYRICNANGDYIWVQTGMKLSRDRYNNSPQIVGYIIDITDKKQAQIDLESKTIEFDRFFSISLDLFCIANTDGYFLHLNPQWQKVLGYSLNELKGSRFLDYVHDEDLDSTLQAIAILKEQMEIPYFTNRYRCKDGSYRWIEWKAVPVGKHIYAAARDVTERKEQEIALQKTNAELARATRLKDEFLANMSHELRTPLNAILGMTEGLIEGIFGEINDLQINPLKTIEQSGNHLLGLINDILDVAKIESGKLELELTTTQISVLCSSSLVFVQQQAMKKRIQLETTLPQQLPDVLIDENRIRQVLINLLTNAVKFTPEEGKITLAIDFRANYQDYSSFAPIHWIPYKAELTPDLNLTPEYLSPPYYLLISVVDTGIGISEEHLKLLFQPFMQIDGALNRQYAGTGLGLVLVQRIIQLHGGQVGLSSIVGQGSHFIIALPCLKIPPSFSSVTTANFGESTFSTIKTNHDKAPLLLLAEDNLANISTISSYLKAKGYQLIMAYNGQQAIAIAETEKPDLIIMDISMPEMDGLTAIQQIRLNPDLATIPIIALTALAMENDEKRCLEAGANKYMTKPVKLKQLTLTIEEILANDNEK